jgi:aspartate/methionine/tyrosine aminotransferase
VRRDRDNRDHVLARLPELGVTQWAPADGAFYAYADVSHLTLDSVAYCDQLLAATGVAITPGVDFAPGHGPTPGLDGQRWVRMSLAGSTEDIDEAMSRWIAHVRSGPGTRHT